MQRKSSMDMFGAVSLTVFSILLAFNQVAITLGTEGMQPVFMAGGASCVFAPVTALKAWPTCASPGVSSVPCGGGGAGTPR